MSLPAPRLAAGRTEGIEPFAFVPFDSFLYAVDILGYSFMSVATLFAARVFVGGGHERLVRWFLPGNGLLLPFIALQMYWHGLIWIAALWAVTFPGSTWSWLSSFAARAVWKPRFGTRWDKARVFAFGLSPEAAVLALARLAVGAR